jgi:predicted transcriptional regulator
MLERIIDSANKSALFALLLLSPNRSFSPKELSKRLRVSEGVVSNVLHWFAEAGLVNSFTKTGRKYYLVNLKHRLIPEIQNSLRRNQRKYEDELFLAIKKLGHVQAAFLSGIFTGQPQLPVDLLLVGKISLPKLDKFMHDVKDMIGQEINYSIMTADEFSVRVHTFDRFIKDIFDYPHLVVVDTVRNQGKGKKRQGSKNSGQFNITHF